MFEGSVMKRIMWFSMLLMFAVLLGCGRAGYESVEVAVDYAWVPEGLTIVNPPEKVGMHEGLLYFVKDTPEQMDINFAQKDGTVVKVIPVSMGNGPGEVRVAFSMLVDGEKIYIYDEALSKIIIYGLDGKFEDEFPVNSDIGTAGGMSVMDGDLYFHGMFAKKLVRVDTLKGEAVKTLEYADPVTDFSKLQGEELKRGGIYADEDTKSIYLGYYNEPYRIEQYDADLELVNTFTRPLREKYDKIAFTQSGPAGNLLIASLKADEKYLYAGFGGGQKITNASGSVKIESIRKDYYISVFDKATGEFVREIRIREIPELYGISNVVGVDRDHIAILFIDMGDTLDNVAMSGADDSDLLKQLGVKTGVVFVKNPMWEDK